MLDRLQFSKQLMSSFIYFGLKQCCIPKISSLGCKQIQVVFHSIFYLVGSNYVANWKSASWVSWMCLTKFCGWCGQAISSLFCQLLKIPPFSQSAAELGVSACYLCLSKSGGEVKFENPRTTTSRRKVNMWKKRPCIINIMFCLHTQLGFIEDKTSLNTIVCGLKK
jgi:hypothetical protein